MHGFRDTQKNCYSVKDFGVSDVPYLWSGDVEGNEIAVASNVCRVSMKESSQPCKEYLIMRPYNSPLS